MTAITALSEMQARREVLVLDLAAILPHIRHCAMQHETLQIHRAKEAGDEPDIEMGRLIEHISDFFKHGRAKLSPELRELLELDDKSLADIGLTRGEVEDFAAGRTKTMRRTWERPDPVDDPVAANTNTDRRRHLHLVA